MKTQQILSPHLDILSSVKTIINNNSKSIFTCTFTFKFTFVKKKQDTIVLRILKTITFPSLKDLRNRKGRNVRSPDAS